jgi:hypothetical protein
MGRHTLDRKFNEAESDAVQSVASGIFKNRALTSCCFYPWEVAKVLLPHGDGIESLGCDERELLPDDEEQGHEAVGSGGIPCVQLVDVETLPLQKGEGKGAEER